MKKNIITIVLAVIAIALMIFNVYVGKKTGTINIKEFIFATDEEEPTSDDMFFTSERLTAEEYDNLIEFYYLDTDVGIKKNSDWEDNIELAQKLRLFSRISLIIDVPKRKYLLFKEYNIRQLEEIKLIPTDDTEVIVKCINLLMSSAGQEILTDLSVLTNARISADNPLTVEWILENQHEAAEFAKSNPKLVDIIEHGLLDLRLKFREN